MGTKLRKNHLNERVEDEISLKQERRIEELLGRGMQLARMHNSLICIGYKNNGYVDSLRHLMNSRGYTKFRRNLNVRFRLRGGRYYTEAINGNGRILSRRLVQCGVEYI